MHISNVYACLIWSSVDSLSDIESAEDVEIQSCDGNVTVATFTELDETADGTIQSCSAPSDLGISVWGARYVGDFVSLLMATTCLSVSDNTSSNDSN